MPQTAIAACNLVSAAAGAAQANTAILTPPATPGLQTVWLAGLTIYGSGATAATVVTATLAGITGGNQLFQINVPAGANTGAFQFFLQFDPPLQGVPGTQVSLALPSFGAGNASAGVMLWGWASQS